ncbi:phage tail protein, partial [Comamonas suwonensis]|uniref:phage tail protein n=1 Tax=Comamonas suwonensis TaxID=2606214 RepID=UPI001A7EB7E7
LPLFTPDTGLLGIDDDASSAQSGGINEIVVKWVDPIAKSDSAVREKNLGAILAARGIAVCEEVNYPGIPTEALARRVARRDLQAKSGFIKRLSVRLDRRGKNIMPGHVFRISDPLRGIDNIVLRAGRVEFGTVTDGTITVVALQDVFGLPATVYREPEENAYVPPDTQPRIPAFQAVMEAPYRELVQAMGSADLAALDSSSGYLHAMAVRPAGMAEAFQLQSRVSPAGYTAAVDMAAWCPGGKLTAAIGPTDTAIELTSAVDLDQIDVGTAALIGAEIVRIDAVDVSNALLTIARGCADTVPAAHGMGTAVLCYDGCGADETKEYTAGVTAEAKLLTRTGSGVLDISVAPVQSITFASRAARPYPPAGLRINEQLQPGLVIGSMDIRWSTRNRVIQADSLVDASMASISPEPGTTYTIRSYINDVLVDEQSNLNASTATISLAAAGACLVEVWAVRDGLESWQAANATFTYRPTPWVSYVDQAGNAYADQHGNTYEG